MGSITLVILCIMAPDDQGNRAEMSPPDRQYRAIAEEYETAFRAYQEAAEKARTEVERKAIYQLPGANPRVFAVRFLALAEKYPGSTTAEDALIWVCTHSFLTRECEDAKRRLVRDHARSAKLGPALAFQGGKTDLFEGTETFLRAVMAQSPHREIRGLASYWLARHLQYKARCVRAARVRRDFGIIGGVDPYKDVFGADWADRLRRLDPDALDGEAEALFERVARYYGEVPHNDKRRLPGPLKDAAMAYLRERRDLAVGKVAPQIEGTDLDGRPFRLSECRSRVVVLDFGSHFYCGYCRETYPQMRALVERHRGRPFTLLSINAEPEKDVEELRKAWKDEGNTWPCLFDGTWEGPIQKAWNIRTFPTIYVLDGEGVIRHKDLRGRDLDKAVETLLEGLPQK
jgi:thiol-disulfide isomerase/thioredoxin